MKPGEGAQRCAEGLWGISVPSETLAPWTSTHAYLVGDAGVGWLIDPGGAGPDADAAIDALLRAAGVRDLKGVLLTHTHRDHVAGIAGVLRRHGPVDVWVHPAGLGRLPPDVGGRPLGPGRRLVAGPRFLTTVATPGHASDHLAFWLPESRALVAGDLVAGRGSTWVGTPDGDVGDYLASLERAAALDPHLVAPAHGPLRTDGRAVLDEARAHRLERERAVWDGLADGPATLARLREHVYPGLDPAAHDLAERSILAHLRKLMRETRVMHLGSDAEGPFARAPGA
jgi:glyoxylase-like metal-dependent hydrolase (beta-lactamase superfamily II)